MLLEQYALLELVLLLGTQLSAEHLVSAVVPRVLLVDRQQPLELRSRHVLAPWQSAALEKTCGRAQLEHLVDGTHGHVEIEARLERREHA